MLNSKKDLLKEIEFLKWELKHKDGIIENLQERSKRYFDWYMEEKDLNKKHMQEKFEELRKSVKELKLLAKEL
ncbi:hypothetical protein N2W29_001792 [Clostridium perfringens]|nr:hypothetical protein [Clostridium perfringens]ELC8350321.1 hypothetical protein [Clostridium perfringens]WEV17383.1 hypothetical protein PL325_07330 [Clostridium perfringens D]